MASEPELSSICSPTSAFFRGAGSSQSLISPPIMSPNASASMSPIRWSNSPLLRISASEAWRIQLPLKAKTMTGKPSAPFRSGRK